MTAILAVAEPVPQTPVQPKRYVLALDGVLFIAILVVILTHTGFGASITLSVSLVLAALSYHFFEKPFLTLKRFFAARPKPIFLAPPGAFRGASVAMFTEESRRAS